MMTFDYEFQRWCAFPELNHEERQSLNALKENDKAFTEAFSQSLSFGTAGLRGRMGMGPAFMNRFTVAWATAGLAGYLSEHYPKKGKVVIARDSRLKSDLFAQTAARVLVAFGFEVAYWQPAIPTPVLSWHVLNSDSIGGIVITASHNPSDYNGYKVYDQHGCQLLSSGANQVSEEAARFQSGAKCLPDLLPFDQLCQEGKIHLYQAKDLAPYKESIHQTLASYRGHSNQPLTIIYSALHGTGSIVTPELLRDFGFTVHDVSSQREPDGCFPTLVKPNPEDPAAYAEAFALAEKLPADLIILNDPDCDRMGAAIPKGDGTWQLLSGNEIGALCIDLLSDHVTTDPAIVLTSNVSSSFGKEVAKARGLKVEEVLTGFKYIGDRMTALEQESNPSCFFFGYEESYGYLYGNYARDKDGALAAILIGLCVQKSKEQGHSLLDHLEALYQEVGWYVDKLLNINLEAMGGREAGLAFLENLRQNPPSDLGDYAVDYHLDYAPGLNGLPKENLLQYYLSNGSVVSLRPSGTEPLLKCYISAKGNSFASANHIAHLLADQLSQRLERS